MGKSVNSPKDIVRDRSEGFCEKCGVVLTRNVHGVPDADSARSIHHRQPKRCGGKDTPANLVQICIGCHRAIHADEKAAELLGWIVIGRFPGNVPFLGWRGWIQPRRDGSATLLDFDLGRAVDLPRPRGTTRRHRVATRQRHRSRPAKRSARAA
jgi:hypothetical protein